MHKVKWPNSKVLVCSAGANHSVWLWIKTGAQSMMARDDRNSQTTLFLLPMELLEEKTGTEVVLATSQSYASCLFLSRRYWPTVSSQRLWKSFSHVICTSVQHFRHLQHITTCPLCGLCHTSAAFLQELSYRKQIARQLRTQYVEGICSNTPSSV